MSNNYEEIANNFWKQKEKYDEIQEETRKRICALDLVIYKRNKLIEAANLQLAAFMAKHNGAVADEDLPEYGILLCRLDELTMFQDDDQQLLEVCKTEQAHYASLEHEVCVTAHHYTVLGLQQSKVYTVGVNSVSSSVSLSGYGDGKSSSSSLPAET